MRCILSVDTGGTKSESALLRDNGVVLGWGICRTPGLSGRSERATRETVAEAMNSAPDEISELHVAHLGPGLPADLFGSDRPFSVHTHRIGEHEGPLHLVDREHGVVVLAGTGAFVHVEAPDGRRLRLDGLGPLLGDCGSGYQIGLSAMRAAVRAHWHPRRQTSLEEVVFSAFGARDALEMIPLNWANLDRCVIAALAVEVDRLANSGDAIARRILEEAAEALAETLRDALDSMDLAEEPLFMVGTGSVAKRSEIYWEHFCRTAAGIAPRLTPVLEPLPSAAGMALAVARNLPGTDRQKARENLFLSAYEYLNGVKGQPR